MPYKTIEEATAALLENMKTGRFCNGYPMPGSNFTKEAMNASKAAGVGKALPAPKKGKVKLGGKII